MGSEEAGLGRHRRRQGRGPHRSAPEGSRRSRLAESDRIRDELVMMGLTLKDGKDPATGKAGTTWEVKR